MSIKVGDRVILKSGGPVMTVRSIYGDEVYCEWFQDGAVKGHAFVLSQLEHA